MTNHDERELAYSSLDPVEQKEAKLTQLHETMQARVAEGMPPRPPPSPRVRTDAFSRSRHVGRKWSCLAAAGGGNHPAGRVDTPASLVLPLVGAGGARHVL